MLLGVLLAVLSGVLVIYIVSQATNSAGETIQLVVVQKTINSNTTLTTDDIKNDFGVESFPGNLEPQGAYVFPGEDALQTHLIQSVVLVEMVPGDILLTQDPRIGPPGTNGQSITSQGHGTLKPGDVLFNFQYASPSNPTVSFITPGDTVDIIVLECNAPYTTSGCTAATTLEGVTVYETFQGSVVFILTTRQAAELTVLANSGTVSIAIRNPADGSQTFPALVTPQQVAHDFFPTPTP
jgi:Flp pilus assembly protein CpaB